MTSLTVVTAEEMDASLTQRPEEYLSAQNELNSSTHGREVVDKTRRRTGPRQRGSEITERPVFFLGGSQPERPVGPKRKLRNSWLGDNGNGVPPAQQPSMDKPKKVWMPKTPPRSKSLDGLEGMSDSSRKGKKPLDKNDQKPQDDNDKVAVTPKKNLATNKTELVEEEEAKEEEMAQASPSELKEESATTTTTTTPDQPGPTLAGSASATVASPSFPAAGGLKKFTQDKQDKQKDPDPTPKPARRPRFGTNTSRSKSPEPRTHRQQQPGFQRSATAEPTTRATWNKKQPAELETAPNDRPTPVWSPLKHIEPHPKQEANTPVLYPPLKPAALKHVEKPTPVPVTTPDVSLKPAGLKHVEKPIPVPAAARDASLKPVTLKHVEKPTPAPAATSDASLRPVALKHVEKQEAEPVEEPEIKHSPLKHVEPKEAGPVKEPAIMHSPLKHVEHKDTAPVANPEVKQSPLKHVENKAQVPAASSDAASAMPSTANKPIAAAKPAVKSFAGNQHSYVPMPKTQSFAPVPKPAVAPPNPATSVSQIMEEKHAMDDKLECAKHLAIIKKQAQEIEQLQRENEELKELLQKSQGDFGKLENKLNTLKMILDQDLKKDGNRNVWC